jgi:hypothetical protein
MVAETIEPANDRILAMAAPVGRLAHHVRGMWGEFLYYAEGVRFEPAANTAYLLTAMCASSAAGCVRLAQADRLLALPATALARGAMEASLSTLWILQPDDPVQREARMLTHQSEWGNPLVRAARVYGFADEGIAEQIDDLHARRAARLPEGVEVPPRRNWREKCDDLGIPRRYAVYIKLCQAAHATADGVSRFELQIRGRHPHSIDDSWRTAIAVSFQALVEACGSLATVCGAPESVFVSDETTAEYEAARNAYDRWCGATYGGTGDPSDDGAGNAT